ncbi:TPA: hypothetical protein DCZ15_01480 [Candidatus Falkowbacteria bacterium]|nr:MAG: hypothetical protein UV95_C0003G0159 [Candidatus Falkowbacteria bacterium GW2011_GWF2_43_32]HBA36527.1 hypothetical protein [Candidatus Falkowbacteria bacterium]
MDKKKLILPISIIFACVIIGGFIYASQVNKQASMERQQLVKIETDKEIEKSKLEMEKRKYIADRKNDCLNIYEAETKKWGNVNTWRYDEASDKCFIVYKEDKIKSWSECDELYPLNSTNSLDSLSDETMNDIMRNVMCKEGKFENSF